MSPGARTASRPVSVDQIMQYQIVTVPPEATVRELVQTLIEEGISGAPVVDAKGEILGVVSATDVLRLATSEAEIPAGQVSWEPLLLEEEADDASSSYFTQPDSGPAFTVPIGNVHVESSFDELTVREIMTPIAFSVAPRDVVGDVVRMMVRGRIHRVLVVEDGVLRGIVTPFDVLRHDYAA
jgi:CBS domain-containing protein